MTKARPTVAKAMVDLGAFSCLALARMAMLEFRVSVNGKRMTHPKMRLPPGECLIQIWHYHGPRVETYKFS